MSTATNILTIAKDKNTDPSQDMKLNKTRVSTQFFYIWYFTFRFCFLIKSPVSCERPTSCIVYRRSTCRNGIVLHEEKKYQVKKKLKECTSLNRDSARVFYARTAAKLCVNFYANDSTLKALDN